MHASYHPLYSDIIGVSRSLMGLKQQELLNFYHEHCQGKWGDVPEQYRERNMVSLYQGGPIVSYHRAKDGTEVAVRTFDFRSHRYTIIGPRVLEEECKRPAA